MLLDFVVLSALAATAIATNYATYRAILYVRTHGLLYNRDAPNSPGGAVFLPLQEFVEPQVQHVEQVKEQRLAKQDDASGSGSEDPS